MDERVATQAQLDLYQLMGRTDCTPVVFSASLEQTLNVPLPDIAQVFARRPEMEVARRILQRAHANTNLQRADARTDPEAIGRYKRNVGLDTAYAALQIDLPFRNRNQGNIASAVAGEHIAQAGLRDAELAVRADVQMAQQNYVDDQKLVAELPEAVQRAGESERLSRGRSGVSASAGRRTQTALKLSPSTTAPSATCNKPLLDCSGPAANRCQVKNDEAHSAPFYIGCPVA